MSTSMTIRNLAPLTILVLPLAAACSADSSPEAFDAAGAAWPASGGVGAFGSGATGNALPSSGGAGATLGTGGSGNTGNVPTGGVGNTGNVPTGGIGNVPTGGVGNTGNVPTGGTGNVPTGGTGNAGTGGAPTNCSNVSPDDVPCETWAEWQQCGSDWFTENDFCLESCGACNGKNTGGSGNTGNTGGSGNTGGAPTGGMPTGGSAPTGGSSNVPNPPPLQNPRDGRATHYWDCCKPSCAWPDQGSAHSCDQSNNPIGDPNAQSACASGNAYQCWSMAPWAVSDTLAYGYAAFNDGACGACYQIEFTGSSSAGYDDPGSAAIANKVLIVQTLNRGGIGGGQFDLLVPGGGVGDFDACTSQWGSGNLGERYGGFFLECRKQNSGNHDGAKTCARNRCQEVFGSGGRDDLLAGCLWWVEWANMADNPNLRYGQVDCPPDISQRSGM